MVPEIEFRGPVVTEDLIKRLSRGSFKRIGIGKEIIHSHVIQNEKNRIKTEMQILVIESNHSIFHKITKFHIELFPFGSIGIGNEYILYSD
jgi:hypothetical protein